MKKIETVADLVGGEIVRIEGGLVRVLSRGWLKDRWALCLNEDLTETKSHLWLSPLVRVLEVIQDEEFYRAQHLGRGAEVDPLKF